ncbi:hypothetical protein CASFOL_038162 [Castilleja foliolosa]|uniref:Uncharacterized protein n=1 Tax=Castilleja foliolosa TaxID=1961234 RepID=A0ABD3BK76_9LAMI
MGPLYERVRGRRIRPPMEEVTKDGHEDKYSVLPESLSNSWREMDTYSDSYLNEYTHRLLLINGHFDPKPWQLRRLAIHERGFCLDNEVKVLEHPNNIHAWSHRQWVCKELRKHPNWHEIRSNEVKYAIDAIRAEPENEMPWTYLKCLVGGKNYKVLNN